MSYDIDGMISYIDKIEKTPHITIKGDLIDFITWVFPNKERIRVNSPFPKGTDIMDIFDGCNFSFYLKGCKYRNMEIVENKLVFFVENLGYDDEEEEEEEDLSKTIIEDVEYYREEIIVFLLSWKLFYMNGYVYDKFVEFFGLENRRFLVTYGVCKSVYDIHQDILTNVKCRTRIYDYFNHYNFDYKPGKKLYEINWNFGKNTEDQILINDDESKLKISLSDNKFPSTQYKKLFHSLSLEKLYEMEETELQITVFSGILDLLKRVSGYYPPILKRLETDVTRDIMIGHFIFYIKSNFDYDLYFKKVFQKANKKSAYK